MARREDLLEKCKILGLEPEKSRSRVNKETGERFKESTVKDAVKAIQSYYIEKYRAEGTLSPFLEDILKMESPMLALQSKDKKLDNIREDLWKDNNNWVFQEKIDGCRCIICYDVDYGWDFYSRNLSVTDELPISYKTKLLMPELNNDVLKINRIKSFILDSEIVPMYSDISDNVIADTQLNLISSILGSLDDLSHTMQESNPLKFMTFDLIKLNDDWITDKSLKDRYTKMIELLGIINVSNVEMMKKFKLVPSTITNKEQFYNNILSTGGEGCVAKDLNSTYDTEGKRAGQWIKIKRTVSQSLLMEEVGDTVDAFVTGFKLGNEGTNRQNQVSALEFSVYLTDDNNNLLEDENGNPIVHHIATISGLTDELRNIATVYVNGEATLNSKFYGAVAEIDGQDVSSRTNRFAHAIFKGWRPDRSADSCKMMKSLLERLVL